MSDGLCLLKVSCCSEGFKLVMNAIVCEAPCCPGLHEVADDDAPHLGVYIACQAPQHVVRTVYYGAVSKTRRTVNRQR